MVIIGTCASNELRIAMDDSTSNFAGVEAMLREIQLLPNFLFMKDWTISIFRDGKETRMDESFVEEVSESIRLNPTFEESMRKHTCA